MAKQLMEDGQVEAPKPGLSRGVTQPMVVIPHYPSGEPEVIGGATHPSYYLTRWPIVNRLLALVEGVTRGKAGLIQRAFTYLLVGGFAACVNLAVFAVMLSLPILASNDRAHNLVAYLVAAEISILANFIPNDRITFSHLPGHSRSWYARCLRFHTTTIAGTIITFVIETITHYGFHVPGLFAEAIGIIIALFFNFTMHHVFTYAHTKEQVL
ncbi:MAG TPA: GtrA family protein [Ktedonobacterales bacterium]|nr:GtrA family protein [Ktedonobacterales bacterium]